MTEKQELYCLDSFHFDDFKNLSDVVQNDTGTGPDLAWFGLSVLTAILEKTEKEILEIYGNPPYELKDGVIKSLEGENK